MRVIGTIILVMLTTIFCFKRKRFAGDRRSQFGSEFPCDAALYRV